MRICFISPKCYPALNPGVRATFGGAEKQIEVLARELATMKEVEVNVLVADYGQSDREVIDGVIVHKVFPRSKNGEVRMNFWRLLSTIMTIRADTYVQRTLSPFSGVLAVMTRLLRKQFVYMMANSAEADGRHPIFQKSGMHVLAWLLFRFSGIVITQNQYQELYLKKRYGRSSVLLRSSMPLRELRYTSRGHALWIGRLEPSFKQPEKYLDLAERLPSVKFVMVAPEATGKREFYKTIEHRAKGIPNLSFRGFVPNDEVNALCHSAFALVNTSWQEGFPATFAEAANNATPIISLAVNPDNVITDNNMGFVCDDNMDQLVDRVQELSEDPDLVRSLGDRARTYAEEYHDVRKNARTFLSLIKKQ